MNKIVQIVLNAFFGVAIITLFVLVFVFKPKTAKTTTDETYAQLADSSLLPIAYLNVDSLLANYTFAQDAQEKLMKKQEDARLKLNTKARTLQNEMADFQRKYENNAFLSADRAQSEYNRLQRKNQELEELEAKLTNEIMEANAKLNMQLADSLMTYLKVFNADGRYQMILANTAKDNILMAAPQYDVTREVIDGMNARLQ